MKTNSYYSWAKTSNSVVRLIPSLCGAFSILVALLVLAGWMFNVPVLQSVVPGFVTMKPNVALCFGFAGAALLLLVPLPLSGTRLIAGRICALLVLAVSG
ncbi:MAG: hypothetical protein AAB353_07925, partial [Candidatus Hydrogenedentota bacterium]